MQLQFHEFTCCYKCFVTAWSAMCGHKSARRGTSNLRIWAEQAVARSIRRPAFAPGCVVECGKRLDGDRCKVVASGVAGDPVQRPGGGYASG